MNTRKYLGILCSLSLLGQSAVYAAVYDLERDYSTTANPAGPWSLGSQGTLGGSFSLFDFHDYVPMGGGTTFDYWQHSGAGNPSVWHNGSTNHHTDSNGGVHPAGSVWYESDGAGSPRRFCTIRFTVPPGGDGTYRVEAAVRSRIEGPISGDYDWHVVHNGVELFGQSRPGNSASGYTNSLVLNAGDVLDFPTGPGNDGTPYASGIKIKARLTLDSTNPAPPSIVAQPQGATVIVGADVAFSVSAIGAAPLAYQWFFGTNEITGATNETLTLNDVELGAAGSYSVRVSNTEGSATSDAAILIVTPPIAQSDYDLERDYSTSANPNGVWSFGSQAILGGNFSLLTLHGFSGNFDYWAHPPASGGPAVWHNWSTNDYTDSNGGVHPAGSVWAEGAEAGSPVKFSTIRFTVPEDGTYLVESVVHSRIHGPISGDYDFHVVHNALELFGQSRPGNSGTGYTNEIVLAAGDVVDFVTGPGADGTSYASGIRIKAFISLQSTNPRPPVLISQPQSQTVIVGGNASFSVSANGTRPLGYQWFFEGAEIAGATSSTLTLNNVQFGAAGDYTVQVSNSVSVVTSDEATLTVVPPPSEADYDLERDYSTSANPNGVWSLGSQAALGGSFNLLTFHGFAPVGGGDQYDYWAKPPGYGPPAVWHNGSTNDHVDSNGGVYPAGSVWFESDYAGTPGRFCTIRFTVPHWGSGTYLVETAVRSRIHGPASGDYDFHVVLNGTELFGQSMPGNSGTGYTNSMVLNGGDILDFLTGPGADGSSYGSGIRIKALISLQDTNPTPPVIVAQPQSRTISVGSDVTFSVSARGTGPLSYQWLFNANEIGGATSATLTLNDVEVTAAGRYTVRVSNTEGSVTSDPALLIVTPAPFQATYDLQRDYSMSNNPSSAWSLGSQPSVGGTFSLFESHGFVPAGGGITFDYWQHPDASNPSVWHNGSTTDHTDSNGSVYPAGSVWYESDNAGSPRHFGTIRFTVPQTAAGTYRVESAVHSRIHGPVSGDYDWHVVHNGAELFGRFMPGHSGTGYSNELTLAVGDTLDFAIGSGSDGNAYASGVRIQALLTLVSTNPPLPEPPAIVSQPQSLTMAAGSSGAFVVTVAGTSPFTYQWFFNGSPLPGATSSTLGIAGAQPSDSGEYRVQVSNWAGSVVSANATLTVQGMPPTIMNSPAEYSVLVGGSVTLSVAASGSAPLSYQWFFNGSLLTNGTGQTFSINNAQMSQAGTYNVVVSNPFGAATNAGSVLLVSELQGTGGTVSFNTAAIRVYDLDGVTRLPVGSTFLGQLYAGPDADQLRPMGAAVPVGPLPGIFIGGLRVITNVAPGAVASVQLRVWESAYGSTHAQAAANGGKTGASVIAQVTTANPNAAPPQPPAQLTGLADFSLVPGVGGLPPAITSHPASQTVSLGAPVTFTVAANGPGVLRYQWQLNGADVPGGVASSLTIPAVNTSDAGDYRVIVSNGGGSLMSDAAVLTVTVERTLAVVSPSDQQEGALVEVPLQLASSGDVGGMTVELSFNPDYLALTEVVWNNALDGALKETHVPAPGRLRAVLVQVGATIPSGTQEVARVKFHARTVPAEALTELNLGVIDVSNGNGDLIPYGTAVRHGSVRIIGGGETLGDNNGNGRLDVGDATLLMGLLAQSDTTRSWDVPENDLNTSGVLDSGDVIRMLSAVSATTAPAPMAPASIGLGESAMDAELAVLSPAVLRGSSGQMIVVQVRLQNIQTPISAASFSLSYPIGALRLAGTQAYRVGSLAAANAAVVWNVAASGRIGLAVSSRSPWAARDGVLAEITFEVLPGAAAQYAWPLILQSVELTPDGYTPRVLAGGTSTFIGRSAVGGRLAGLGRNGTGQFEFTLAGDSGATYVVEASTDLANWTTLSTVIMPDGGVQVVDPNAAHFNRRFYRARPLE